MWIDPLHLAASSALLRLLGASSGGTDLGAVHSVTCSSALSELKEDSVEMLEHKLSLARISMRTLALKSRLISISRSILVLADDESLRLFDHSRIPGYIEDLHKGFFDALEVFSVLVFDCPLLDGMPRLYPSSLDEVPKISVLHMSPRRFKMFCDECYDKSVLFYEGEIARCNTEKKSLESKIAAEGRRYVNYFSDSKKAMRSLERVRGHESSLAGHEKEHREYNAKLQTCRGCYKELMSLSRKVLGESSVSALYVSCLLVDRSLAKEEHATLDRQVPLPGGVETPDSPQEPECAICTDPQRPGEENISCVNAHEFHQKCLYRWCVLGNETCPACREALTENQRLRLARCGRRSSDRLCNLLHSDPSFDERYVRASADRVEAENSFLEDVVCRAIRTCASALQNHPSYPVVFGAQEDSLYGLFYIPQKMVSYFENTEVGHHDPRSKGFIRHRTVLIGLMSEYVSRVSAANLDLTIVPLIDSMLNVFFAADSLLEHLYTELHTITSAASKIQVIKASPQAYPCLHGLLSRHPNHSFDQIDAKLKSTILRNGLGSKIYLNRWVARASEMFSQIASDLEH